ncbi:hypothetical protein D3C72_1751950 [compost metagenome]
MHWRIGPIADFALPCRASRQRGGKAQAIQADVLRVLHEILGVTRHHQRCGGAESGGGVIDALGRRGVAKKRRAAVVVHEVGAKLGVQRLEHVA